MRSFALVALCLAATVSAVPAIPPSREILQCAGYCKGGSKFKYEVGSTYVYEYTAATVTSVSGAGDEESSLDLSAAVEFHAVSQCDFTMQLHDVKLKDSTPDEMPHLNDFSSALERHALLFTFQDGTVDELCANNADPTWVLNIKRGVLSAFQNSMKDLHTGHKLYETDVTGDCETEYSILSADETGTVVSKEKNLVACAHRMDHFLSLQSTPYNSESHARSLPLVKSDHKCVQTFVNGHLALATCKESHLFRPFSNGDSGAVTNVMQNLVLKRTDMSGLPGRTGGTTTRTKLLFQHTAEEGSTDSRAQTIVSSLEELEKKTHAGIQSDTPRVFSQLVATLRTTSYPTLAKVFSRTRQQHTRKFLLDAMPLVGTADGLTVMTDLYKSGEITDAEMDSWLTSLTFLKRPTITMLLAISSLLDGQPRPKAVLGLSALVHSYCQTDRDCHEKEPVQDYLSKIERLLGDGCHVKGRKDMELKIVALKGIGNMGVPPTSLHTITKCYLHSDNPLEVRLAAIGAHRRLPCAGSWTSSLLNTYTDMQQDTELRIAAYLMVMQCPSTVTLAKIKETLYSEEVNQVASFVWTHLTNIQETSSRWKQSIKDLITSDFLQNKFHTDARKFSRNYEGSMFLESLNAGATIDSNIIFTPQSYLPRSASLNLTLDLFGESINVFEIGSRAEGFEQIVENMFGPGGYFPDKSLKKVLQNARGKRDEDLENSIDQISKIFDANSKLNIEPQASIYARVFGNEIHYSRYQGLGELIGGHPHLDNPLAFISKLLGGQDVDYTNSFVFLDASYRFPTAVGLSLELAVNGSATVGLKASGHMDLSHSSIDVRGRIAPSAAVRVVGTMVVDAMVTKAGLRSISSLHTNTYLDGQATVRGSSLVDVKLNVPREKVEILEVTSRMFVLRRQEDLEVAGILEDREVSSGCSSESVGQVIGMQLCGELAYPNASRGEEAPHFPLTGPVTLRIDLVKTDIFDAYELNFQQQSQADGDIRVLKLHFDTPNSKIDRNIVTFLSLDRRNTAIKGNLQTPFIKLDVVGKLDYNEKSKAVDLTVHMNDETLFATKAAVKISHNSHLSRYEPSLFLVIRNVVDMGLHGKVNYIEGTKYSADFTLSGLTEKALLFSADFNCDGGKYDMAGSIKSPLVEGSIHANLRQTNSFVNTKVTVDYSVRQAKPESVNLSAKIQSSNKRALQKNSVYVSLQMSALPQYNLVVRWDRMSGENYLEYNGRFGLGKTEWQTKQLYRFHAHGSDDINFAFLCHLACPTKNVDYRAEVQYKTTDSSITTHSLAQLNAHHKFYSSLNFLRLDEKQEIAVEVSCPWYITSLKGEVMEREPGHFITQMEGRYEVMGQSGVSKVQSLAVHSIYIDGSTDTRLEQKLSIEMSGVWAAKLAGEVMSEAGSSNLWIQLDVHGNKYRADVTYTRNSITNHIIHATVLLVDRTYHGKMVFQHSDIEAAFSIDLQLNKRLALATKTFNDGVTQGVEFELMWDKDLDPSRRISLMVHSNNVKREALLEFPGQYIKAELVTLPKSVGGLLEWAADQKIAMNLEWNIERDGANAIARLTTPFPGIETQSMSASYKYNNTVMQMKTDVAWQHQKMTVIVAGVSKSLVHHASFVDDKLSGFTTFEVEARVTSTIKSLADISATYKHQQFIKSHIKSISVLCNKKAIFIGSLTSEPSEFKTDLYLNSPFKMIPSIQGNFSRAHNNSQGCNCSLQFNVGLDNKLAAQVGFNRNSGLSGLLQVSTTYVGFKNTTAKFAYSNNGGNLNLVTDIEHNKHFTSLSLVGSKTSALVLGSGTLITPFTKPFEAGFTHSLEQGYFKEGISMSFDSKQMLLASLVGTFRGWSNFKLTSDITLPSHSLITNMENHLESATMKTEFEGILNGDRLASSLLIANQEVQFIATVLGSSSSQEVQLVFNHKHKPGVSYSTNLQLSGYLIMSHILSIENLVNWKNVIHMKTSANDGKITNVQSFKYNVLQFAHNMAVEWNGPKASAEVTFSLDNNSNIVKEAEGILTTHWTRPIRLIFYLPVTETTVNPKLKLQYDNNQEIIVESLIQYEPMMSKVQLEVKSPFCKPISINALYDISVPTKSALMTVQWDDERIEFKSTAHFETGKAMGLLLVTKSKVEGQIVHAQFKYNVAQRNAMTGHLTAGYRDLKIDIDLSASLSDVLLKGNCGITTPFSTWEKLTASFNIDVSKPSSSVSVVTVGRNKQTMSLFGSIHLGSPWILNTAFTSTFPSVPNASLNASLEVDRGSRVLKLLCNYKEHRSQLMATLLAGEELRLAEVSMQTSFKSLEKLLGHASFSNKPGDKSISIVLMQNDLKVQVDSKCVWKENSTGEATVLFYSPFEGLEKLSASLKHTTRIKPDKRITTLIVLTRNDEIVEMSTSIVTAMDALTFNVQCKTPIIEYKMLTADLSIKLTEMQKSAVISLVKNGEHLEGNAILKINGLWNAEGSLQMMTPFQGYETLSAGFDYNWVDTLLDDKVARTIEGKAKIYLEVFDDINEIQIDLNYSPTSHKSNIKASLLLPILNVNSINIEGKLDVKQQLLDLQGKVNDEFMNVHAKLLKNSIDTSILSSITGYEKITLTGVFTQSTDKKVAKISLAKNDAQFIISMTALLNTYTSELHIESTTPITSWQKLKMDAKYDMTKTKKSAEFLFTRLEEQYAIAAEWSKGDKMAEYGILLNTPVRGLRTLKLLASYDITQHFSARTLLQTDMHTIEGTVSATDKEVRIVVETPLEQIRHIALVGSYNFVGSTKSLVVQLERNNDNNQFDVALTMEKGTANFVVNTPFSPCRTFSVLLRHNGLLTNKNKSLSLSMFKNSESVLEISGELDLDWESRIGLNFNASIPFLSSEFKKLSLEAEFINKNPLKSIIFHFRRNHASVVELKSSILLVQEDGFTYIMKVAGNIYDYNRNELEFELHSKDSFVKSILTFVNNNARDKYSAQLTVDNTYFKFDFSSPVDRYDNLSIHLRKSPDSMLVDFTTSFFNYDVVKLSGKISTKIEDENFVSFSMAKDQETTEFNWRLQYGILYAKSSLAISSPFSDYKNFTLNGEYDFQNESKTATLALSRSNHSVKIASVLLFKDKFVAESSINVTTSFSDLQDIKLYGSIDMSKPSHKNFIFLVLLNDARQISITFDLESSPKKGKVAFASVTPFYEMSFGATGSFDFCDPSKLISFEGVLSALDVIVNVSAVIEDNLKRGELHSTVRKDTVTYEGKMSWLLENDQKHKKARVTVDLGGGNKVETKASVIVNGLKNMKILLNFTDFYSHPYVITADWNVGKHKIESKFGYQWSGQQVYLESLFEKVDSNFTTNIKFTSPLKTFEDILFQSKLALGNIYEFDNSLQWGKSRRVGLNILCLVPLSQLQVKFESPYTSPLFFSLNHLSTYTSSELHAHILTSFNYGLWKNELNAKFDVSENIDIDVTLVTPLHGVTFLHLNGKLKSDVIRNEASLLLEKENQKWQLSGVVLKGENKADVVVEVTTPMHDFKQGQLLASYDLSNGYSTLLSFHQNEKILISGSINLSSGATIGIRTPCQGVEDVSADCWVDIQGHVSQLEAQSNFRGNKAEVKATITVESDKKILTKLHLKSPWTLDFSLDGMYNGEANHAVKMTVRHGEQVTEILGTLGYSAGDSGIEVEFDSLIEGFGSISAKAGFNWKYQQKTAQVSVRLGDAEFHARARGEVTREGINGDLHIDIPLDNLKLIEVKVQLEKSGSVTISIDNKVYQLHYMTIYSADSVGGQVSVSSPDFQLQKAAFNVKFGKNFFNFNGEVEGEKVDFVSSYQFDRLKTYVNAKLQAPIVNALQHIEVNIDLDLIKSDLTSMVQWSPAEKINIGFKFGAQDFHLNLQTPFINVHNLEVSSQIVLRDDVYNLLSRANWDGLKIDFDGALQLDALNINLNLQSEWGDGQTATMRTALSGAEDKIRVHAIGMVQEKQINIVGEIDNANLSAFSAKLKLEIPFFNIAPLYAEAHVTKELWSACNVDIRVSLPQIVYKATASYGLADADFKAGLDLDIPFIKSSLTMGGSFTNNNYTEMETNIFVNSNKISASYEVQNSVFTGAVDINVPDLGISDIRVDAQTSLAFNPDIQGSITFRSGRYSGSVAASLLKSNMVFSTQIYFDLPQFFGALAHTARASVNLSGSRWFLEVRLDNGHSTKSVSLEIHHSGSYMSIVGHVIGPVVGDNEVSLLLQNNLQLLMVNIIDVIHFELKNDIHSSSATVKFANEVHRLSYQASRNGYTSDISLIMESSLLRRGNINIHLSFETKDKNLQTTVKCVVGSFSNEAVMQFTNEQKIKAFSLKIVKASEVYMKLDISSRLKDKYVQNDASFEWSNTLNTVSLQYSPTWPIYMHLTVTSPHFTDNLVEVKLSIQASSVMAYAALGEMELNQYVSLIANFDMNEKTANFEFQAPSCYFVKTLTFNGVFKTSRHIVNLSFDGHFSSKAFSDSRISTKFMLSKAGVASTLSVQTPLTNFKNFEIIIQIPFTITKQYDLELLVSFPTDLKYAVYARMHTLTGAFELAAGAEYGAQKMGAALKLAREPVAALDLVLDTPFKNFKHYQLQLRGQHSLVDGNDVLNYIEWNDQRIELRHSTIYVGNKFDYRVQLITPFRSFKRFVAGLQYEFDIHKKAVAFLSLPGMEDDWTIEFDFRLNNLMDSSFLINIQVPIFSGFKAASLLIGSKYDSENGNYRGVISGNYNQHELVATLDGVLEGLGVKVDAKTQINTYKVNAQILVGLRSDGLVYCTIEIDTPFSLMKSGKASLQVFNQYRLIQANIMLNSIELINLIISKDEHNMRIIEVRNPWRPVSLAYSLYFNKDIGVWGEVCWDLNNKSTSRFGGGFIVTNESYGKHHVSVTVKLPTRDVSLNFTRHHTSSILEYSTSFSWERGQTLGYRVLYEHDSEFKWSALARLDFPFRAFELSSHMDIAFETHSDLGAQFMWDAAIDRSKRMGLDVMWTPNNAELSLQHAAMKHNIALRIEQENCVTHNSDKPHTVKIVVEYSPFPQDLFVIGTSYQRFSGENTGIETLFLIRHDASNLDHSILFSASQTPEHSSSRFGVNFKNSHTGDKHKIEIYTKLRLNDPDIEVSILDSNNRLSVKGSLWSKENGYRGFSAQLTMNQKEPLSLEGQINLEEMTTELHMSYGSSRGYTLSAGMPTPRLISAGITRTLHGLPSADAQVTLRLNTSRLLWTKVRWHPRVFEEMQQYLFQEYDDVSLVAQNIANSYSKLFDEDVAEHLVRVCSAICSHSFANVRPYTIKEMQYIAEDFADVTQTAKLMYRNNAFFSKDIHQFLTGTISYIQEKGYCLVTNVVEFTKASYLSVRYSFEQLVETFSVDLSQINNVFKELQEMGRNASQHVIEMMIDLKRLSESLQTTAKNLLMTVREAIAQVDGMVNGMFVKLEGYLVDMVAKFYNTLRPHIITVQGYFIVLHNSVSAIQHSINEMVKTVFTTIMAVKELEELVILYEEYSGWLEEFQVQEYLNSIFQYLNIVGEIMIEDFQRMFADYKVPIDATLNLMNGQLEKIDRVPAVTYAKLVINTVYEKVSWVWKYHDLSKRLELYLQSIFNNLDEIVAELLHSVDTAPEPRTQHGRHLVMRPGYLEISQRLPVEWESFQQWPEFSQFTAPISTDIAGVDGYHSYMMAALTKLTPNFSEVSLLPPFGAVGLIAGKQHFITFDHRFYDFVGECSYLLASDFLDNKFSIIVNYDVNDGSALKKSLTVISEEHRIDISANFQITVDGKKTELPATVGNAIMLSRSGDRLLVASENNMAIECNVVHDICTVELTGWNFGKTGGLLGTFDNEPSNDVSLPNGTITTDLARFASSWLVGSNGRCLSVNNAPSPPANDDAIDACDAYFTDTESPLAACYGSIDPMPYYHMCISDMMRVADDAAVCTAAIAYVTQCNKAGIEAVFPTECVQCHLPNSPVLSAGESKVLNGGAMMSADIVFVVEQAACLKGINLAKMATKLDAALIQQGLTDNRFSVVGFGGETFPQPHTRTAKGDVWTSGRGIEKAFSGLVLDYGSDMRDEQSVYQALRFASRLSFRGGVSKTLVLVQCSACIAQLDYGDMMGLLLQSDITLHLLEPGVITLRGGTQRANGKVLGADLSGVYTARNGKNVKPNAGLLKQMILPKDHCSPLAFETNGTVFNLEPASSTGKQLVAMKKFADVWSRRVAQAARPSPCQKCECVANKDGVGQVQCSTCVTASVDQFLLDWQSLLSEDYGQIAVSTTEDSEEVD